MRPLDKDSAARAIDGLALEPGNRTLAQYWLSLWRGDALPPRAALSPAQMKRFLPLILLLDTVPEKSVTIRLAGTHYRKALGTELTGQDWIALAPPAYRAERLRIFSEIARGAVGVGHRHVPLTYDPDYVCEEIVLPFAADDDGSSPVLVHVNWRRESYAQARSVPQALGDPLDFRLCALA